MRLRTASESSPLKHDCTLHCVRPAQGRSDAPCAQQGVSKAEHSAPSETPNAKLAEAYPREFYRYIGAPPRARWSKRRRADRLLCVPALLAWAQRLGVSWEAAIGPRVAAGLAAGPHGEDEFDAVVGLLGTISVLLGAVPAGVPPDDAVRTVEGWILGRAALHGAE